MYNNNLISICGDIHLNLRDNNFKSWEISRFLKLFDILANDKSKTIILSGDIFDKPKVTLEEIGIFYEGIEKLHNAGKVVYIIDGNHEEIDDTTTTFDLLPHTTFTRIKMDYLSFGNTHLWLVGHPHIDYITNDNFPLDYSKTNILISHYRSDIGVAKEEIDNGIVSAKFSQTILSDIHYKLQPAHNIQYTSSPYSIHFTPKKTYGYTQLLLDGDKFKVIDVELSLPSKEKVTVKLEALDNTLKSLNKDNFYNVEVIGEMTPDALALLKNNSVVSKYSFTGFSDENVTNITEDLLTKGKADPAEMIIASLEDLELTAEELERARKIIAEEL